MKQIPIKLLNGHFTNVVIQKVKKKQTKLVNIYMVCNGVITSPNKNIPSPPQKKKKIK